MATIRPTLIVGIGTTGLEILEDLENLWIVTFSTKIPSIFQLVVLETNRTYANPTPLGESQIKVINIGQDNITKAKNIVRDGLHRDPFWLEGIESLAGRSLENVRNSTAGGSYHIRGLGRQSLWASWHSFSDTLNTALSQINSSINAPGFIEAQNFFNKFGDNVDNNCVAYVVGSSGGGTGSGIFIDIGHYLRGHFGNNGTVFGMLLLPIQDAAHLNLNQIDGKIKLANTAATLEELMFYLDQRSCGETEDLVWPNNLPRYHNLPYDLIYLEGSLQLGRRFTDIERAIAFRLFLGLFGISHQVIAGGSGGAGFGTLKQRFVTSGLTAFYHPRREIVEASASILGVQLINDLTSSVGSEEPKVEMRKWLSDAVENWIAGLSGTVSRPEDDIKKEVDRLQKGECKNLAELNAELEPRFLPGPHGRYLGILDGNLLEISNRLKTQFGEKLIDIANQHKSLMWAKESASGISDVIDEIFNHWNEIGVPVNEPSLPEAVKKHFEALKDVGSGVNPFDFGAARLGKYHDVIYERLIWLLKLIKAYKLRKALNDLKTDSETRSKAITTEMQNLENVKSFLLNEPARLHFHIQAGSTMLLPVYSTGIFEGDVGTTIGNAIGVTVIVNQVPGGGFTVTANNVFLDFGRIPDFLAAIFGGEIEKSWIPDDIWSMLHPGSGRNTFKDIALGIKANLINHVALTEKVPDVNVTSVAGQRGADAINLANGARTGFLDLDAKKQGESTPIISGVLGRDSGNLQPIATNLATNSSLNPLGIKTFASDALKDFVAFCFEAGNISLDLLMDYPVWQNWYNDPVLKHDYLLNTFDLNGCIKIEKMRELVQMALHLLITYRDNDYIPILSHAGTIFTAKNGKVVFSSLIPPIEVSDPINGSDINKAVKVLASNPNLEANFKNNLKIALNNPVNGIATLQDRLSKLYQILGPQKIAELQRKYFGDAATNVTGLLNQII